MNGRAALAWNLRRLRAAKGISQEALAADASIDRAYISEIERGTVNASIDLMDRLAACLGVAVVDLVRVPDEGARPPDNLRPGRKRQATKVP